MYRPPPRMPMRPMMHVPRMMRLPSSVRISAPMNNRNAPMMPHIPFDLAQCESSFPSTVPVEEGLTSTNDKLLTDLLLKRCQELTPSPTEQQLITALVTQLSTIMDELIISPSSFEAAQFEELRLVGSYKKGTMITGHNVADAVVIFKTLPTKEAITAFMEYLVDRMRSSDMTNSRFLTADVRPFGFEIMAPGCSLKIMIATMPANVKKLDAELHLNSKVIQESLASVRHIRWFEEYAGHTSIKLLIRLLKDLRQRYEGFEALSPWSIDLLSHYAILNNPSNSALPIHQAFKRVFQLLSSGIFLPGSAGIIDPCEQGRVRLHSKVSLEQQDELCCTAQTLLRVLSHGGYKEILGYSDRMTNYVTEMSKWKKIIVVPSDRVYDRSDQSNGGDSLLDEDLIKDEELPDNIAPDSPRGNPIPVVS